MSSRIGFGSARSVNSPGLPCRTPPDLSWIFSRRRCAGVGRGGFQVGRIRYWDPLLGSLFPPGTRVLVRYDPRDLSKVFVPAPDQSEYLSIPYSDLRRPPITLAELERARSILTAKGDSQPSEEQLFATAEQQRQIEDAAARKSRTARRNTERRPSRRIPAGRIRKGSPVNYEEKVVPYKGEVW
jgi:hypothetical protein